MACSIEKSDHSMDSPKVMSLHMLNEITNNFSHELGVGYYGTVYKGKQNGIDIAVKMLRLIQGIDDYQQFKKEFENLYRLRHPNIVQLLGYCYEINRKYVDSGNGRFVFADRIYRALSFEYMHNGNLRKYISGEFEGLDWQARYKIIKGICEGLKYLHKVVEIYHLDLKPENILLDENMMPKLADFGLSRLVDNEHTRATESPVGTNGYTPPEYIEKKLISQKFDIFSLGVVIIEIMAGHEGYIQKDTMSPQEFIDHVHVNWRKRLQKAPGTSTSLVDVNQVMNQVKRCVEIASECVRTDRTQRPEIGAIIYWLNETEHMTKKIVFNESTSDQQLQIEKVSSHSMQLLEFHTANLRSTNSEPLAMSTAASPLQRIRESDGYIYMDGKSYMPRQSQLSGSDLGMRPHPAQLLGSSSSNTKIVSQSQELALQPSDEDEGLPEDAGGKGGKDGSCSSVSGASDSENTETVLPHPTAQPQQFQQRQLLTQMTGLKQPSKLDEHHSEDESSEFEDDLDEDLDDEDHSEDEAIEFDDDLYDDPRALMAPIRPTGGRGDRNGGNVGSNQVGMLPQQMPMMMPNIRSPSMPGVGQIAMPLPPAQQVSMARWPPNMRSQGIPPPMGQTGDMPPTTRPSKMDGAIFPNIRQMGRMRPPPPPPPPLPPQHIDMNNMIRPNNDWAGTARIMHFPHL